MRESLESAGRYDPVRVRDRFLAGFEPINTKMVLVEGKLVGFYMTTDQGDHIYIDHFYIHPDFQGRKIGSYLLNLIVAQARKKDKIVRLGALKGSRSNSFYLSHGFVKTHEEEFDKYYELQHP